MLNNKQIGLTLKDILDSYETVIAELSDARKIQSMLNIIGIQTAISSKQDDKGPFTIKVLRPQLRDEGFYWVKYSDQWIVAEYRERVWYMTETDNYFDDSDFQQIDEHILIRKK